MYIGEVIGVGSEHATAKVPRLSKKILLFPQGLIYREGRRKIYSQDGKGKELPPMLKYKTSKVLIHVLARNDYGLVAICWEIID